MFFENFSKKDVYLNLISFVIGLTMLSMMLKTPTEVRIALLSTSILGLIFLKGSIDLMKQILNKYYIYLIFVLICLISYFLYLDDSFPLKNYPEVENFFIFFIFFIFLNQIQHHYLLIVRYCIYTAVFFLSFSIPFHLFFLESSMLTSNSFIFDFQTESYSNKSTFAIYLALLFPFLIFELSKRINLINSYNIFIFAISIFYFFSRSALILTLAGLLLCIFSFERKLSITAIFISSVIFSSFWFFEITPKKYNELKMQTNIEYFNSFSYDSNESLNKSFSTDSARFKYLKNSYEGFIEKPIFGHGLASFRRNNPVFSDDGKLIRHPTTHNDFAQIMYELGLIGLIVFIGMLYLNLRSLFTNIHKIENKIMVVQFLVLILAINSINLIDHILFWFIMAITYRSFKNKKTLESN